MSVKSWDLLLSYDQPLVSSGLPGLDALFGGGIDRGSSTLILGATGVGKSTIAMQYAYAAAERGERAVMYLFDENLDTAKKRARGLGLHLDSEAAKQYLSVEQINPAELSPGEFIFRIRREVQETGAKVIVIDSLDGLRHSMPDEREAIAAINDLRVLVVSPLGRDAELITAALRQSDIKSEPLKHISLLYGYCSSGFLLIIEQCGFGWTYLSLQRL